MLPAMSFFLGIDVGTSGTKALLLRPDGSIAATTTADHTLQTPRVGWSEQDPEQWWNATQISVAACIEEAGISADEVTAIGLSGQMHGSVFLDDHDEVLRPALLWNDQRTAKQCDSILQKVGGPDRMLEMVGNLPLTGYTVPKVLWFREHEPELWRRCKRLLLPKDYIRLKLTGDHATDAGDASGTALLDVVNRRWSDELIGLLDLDELGLPKVYESPEVTGVLHERGAAALGLKAGTPVVAGAGDVMSGAIGNGIVERGLVNAILGTSGVICVHSDEPTIDNGANKAPAGRVATMCHAVPGNYVIFGCMLSAAGSLQWYADAFRNASGGDAFGELMALAAEAPAGCEGLLFMPHLTGERCPYPDPDARGGWVGATRRTGEAELVRSLIEGVTFNMNAMLKIMSGPMNVPVTQVRTTGGGAKSKLWRQIQADIYGAPVAITNSEEGGAFGAALLAAVGGGAFASVLDACRALIRPTETVEPDADRAAIYARLQGVYDSLYPALAGAFEQLVAIDA